LNKINYIVFTKVTTSILIFFLLTDFFLGKKIFNFIESLNEKNAKKMEMHNRQQNIGAESKKLHHVYKKYLQKGLFWGDIKYTFCTDEHGFRSNCKNKSKSEIQNKKFDVGIIGDSFTEGMGVDYENTFAGIVARKLPNKRIANLGVASHSPSLYYLRLNELIEANYTFNEIFVYVDISDIQDEAIRYKLDETEKKILIQNSDEEFAKLAFNLETKKKFINEPKKQTVNEPNKQTVNEKIKYSFKEKLILNLPISYYFFYTPLKNKISGKNFFDRNTFRANWTYSTNNDGYGENGIEKGIKNSIRSMKLLSDLLKKNNIKFTIAVYPWPHQLLYDQVNSRQVNVWKNFCKTKCDNFINHFPDFFEIYKKDKKNIKKLYFKRDWHFNKMGHKLIAKRLLENM